MRAMRPRFACAVSSLLALMICTGCTVHRKLRITEVGDRGVELYLEGPQSDRLNMAGHRLTYTTSTGATNTLELSHFGTMNGGTYLVVWEDLNDPTGPERKNFSGGLTGAVPGIRVPAGFFGTMGDDPAAELRVYGKRKRGTVTDKTDDCVRWGDKMARPETGGTFYNGSNLPNPPGGSANHQRRWDAAAGRPVDNDEEDDWYQSLGNTWGARSQF